jgi:hypothetical protein
MTGKAKTAAKPNRTAANRRLMIRNLVIDTSNDSSSMNFPGAVELSGQGLGRNTTISVPAGQVRQMWQ